MAKPPLFTMVPATKDNIRFAQHLRQPFTRFGRLVPTFDEGQWRHTEELWETGHEYAFPPDTTDSTEYIGQSDKQIYFLFAQEKDGPIPAGMVRLSRYWNGNCWLEELAVAREYRRQGCGRLLMAKAEEWALAQGLHGMVLEAQDVNLAACRFYLGLGYTLGGVDRLLYHHTPSRGELALFFYKVFQPEYWDVYDRDRRLRPRRHLRGAPLAEGDFHLAVSVWVRDEAGRYLLTRRTANKTFANLWENPGGAAQAGETSLQTALREVREETCLILDPDGMELMSTVIHDQYHQIHDNWRYTGSWSLADVRLQPCETWDAMAAAPDTIRQMSRDGQLIPVLGQKELEQL